MNQQKKQFHIVLKTIIEDFGREVLLEDKAEGLMADLMGRQHKLGPIMRSMLQCGITQRILKLDPSWEDNLVNDTDNMKLMLQDNFFLRPTVASYVVDSYCYALGFQEVEPILLDDTPTSGIPEGELSFSVEDDGEFCGYRNDDGDRSGFGILRSNRGDTYAGEWRAGMKMGFGMGFAKDTSRYAGEWRMNRHSGLGIEVNTNGMRYAGLWKNGMRNGVGMLVFPGQYALCGLFSNSKYQEGFGALILQDGSIIIGNMTENGPDGECTHFYRNGEFVKEYWIRGKKK